jgi:hypothetical protein
MFGETQIGKTKACLDHLTNDNKRITFICVSDQLNQMEQFYKRAVVKYPDYIILKIFDKKFTQKIINAIHNEKHIIVFFINTKAQIRNINNEIHNLETNHLLTFYTDFLLIIDEGDIIVQTDNETELTTTEKEWEKLFKSIEMINVKMNTVFVTATVDSLINHHVFKIKSKNVLILQRPDTYKSIDNFVFTEIPEDQEDMSDFIDFHIQRINNSPHKEIILLPRFHVNQKQSEYMIILKNAKPNQVFIVNNAKYTKVYAGNNLVLFDILHNEKTLYKSETIYDPYTHIFTFPENKLEFDKLLSLLNISNARSPIVIGRYAFDRGMSIVSSRYHDNGLSPIYASTIIDPSITKKNQVGLTQMCGRLCGTVQGSNVRHCVVKSSTKMAILAHYHNTNEARRLITESIENGTDEYLSDIFHHRTSPHDNGGHPVERPNVNKMCEVDYIPNLNNNNHNRNDDENIMIRKINEWWNNNSIIARTMMHVYHNRNLNKSDLKMFITNCGSTNSEAMYQELIRRSLSYDLIFTRANDITNITEPARTFMNTLN